uniref:DNA binding protein n=1 Tax=Rhizophora mucronata TaxID=61149 RepID=A0A2P2KXC9_RHIMU
MAIVGDVECLLFRVNDFFKENIIHLAKLLLNVILFIVISLPCVQTTARI